MLLDGEFVPSASIASVPAGMLDQLQNRAFDVAKDAVVLVAPHRAV